MMKYANYLILFMLLSIGAILHNHIHISTNLLSLFASKEAIEKFKIADNLGYSKEMFVIVKGFDKSSKKKVREISKELKKINNILLVQSSIMPSEEIQDFYKKYYTILASFDNVNLSSQEIKKRLQELYSSQENAVFYTAIDKNDPLKLFELQSTTKMNITHRGGYITLGDYGYLIRVSTDVSASQMTEAKVLYDDLHVLLDNYEGVISFAPFYYTVENSSTIKKDVQLIVVLSTIILFIIYYFLLKNIRLLSQTVLALFSSMVFAGLLSTLLFTNFNALSLAFGMSISAVSIDYLLHYYFHNFYKNNKKIDKSVLYGYMTTIVAFGIFSFIPIPIIAQISFFAVASLSFAYMLFTFIFPYLNISEYKQDIKIKTQKKIVSPYIIFGVSIILFIYSGININLDNDIKNLDYQNTKLKDIQKMLKNSNKTKLTPVIVHANTKEQLIDNLHLLKNSQQNSFSLASFIPSNQQCLEKKQHLKSYDFARVNEMVNKYASSVGFRDGYFKDSYEFVKNTPNCMVEDLSIFNSFSLSAYRDNDILYTIALVNDIQHALKLDFVSSISAKEIFSKVAQQMYKDLLLYSIVVIIAIFSLLLLSVKKRFIYALNYIIFPMSLTLAILVSFLSINLMHLFSLIILIAIGIDYGIYMSNTQRKENTIIAIKYSLLSTFAAFGVLIFSSIVALKSIGIVITLGASAIFLLIRSQK